MVLLLNRATHRLRKQWNKFDHSWRRLPDFLIIGTQKGGTTSLFDYLAQHPELALPEIKEINYFDRKYAKGPDWYRGFFPYRISGKKTGESTPYYLFHPLVAERVAKDLPRAKLIILLRDPVSRAFSHYQMMRKRGVEPFGSFVEAIAREEERIQGENKKITGKQVNWSKNLNRFSYLSRGMYASQLERWFARFPRDQFLILKSEDFFADPQKTLERTCDFLGLKRFTPPSLPVSNPGKYAEQPDAEAVARLRARLQPDMDKLAGMIGPEFKWW